MKIDNFTLFIPVRDRHYNLSKIFKYYGDLECEKIIADSSINKYEENVPNDFTYVYYGPTYVYKKYYDVVSKIKNDYILYCADDDITLKFAIKKCVDFLKINKDYSCCDGEYYELYKNNLLVKYKEEISNCIINDFKSNLFNKRLNFFLKLNKNGKNYYPHVHSVIRTEIVKLIYKNILNNKNNWHIGFTDLFFTYMLSIHGNLKTLPILYQIRKVGDRLVDRNYIKNELNINKRLIDNDSDKSINKNIKMLANILSKINNISVDEAFKITKKLFLDFKNGIDSRINIEDKNINYVFNITNKKYKDEIKLIKKIMLEE